MIDYMNNISQSLLKFKPSQLQIFTSFLIFYSLCAALFTQDFLVLALFFYTCLFSYLTFKLLRSVSKKPKQFHNTIISSLIFFLIFHYTNSLIGLIPYSIGLVSLQLYKHFGYFKGLSIINPTLLGLVAAEFTVYIIQTFFQVDLNSLPFISWWGAQFGTYFSLILILIWIIYGLRKWNKHWIFIPFFSLFILTICLLNQPQYIIPSLLSSTTYFFAAIMLIEPRTSPTLSKQQIIYGLLAGLLYFSLRHFGINYYELISLALANLYHFASRQISTAWKY